jgi:hypothetical protein
LVGATVRAMQNRQCARVLSIRSYIGGDGAIQAWFQSVDIAEMAAPFVHPKLQVVVQKNFFESDISSLSDAEIMARIAAIDARKPPQIEAEINADVNAALDEAQDGTVP